MGLLDRFRRKKESEVKERKKTSESVGKSILEELCRGDDELLFALTHTVLIDPERLYGEGIDFYIEKAEEFEKEKDFLRARINYQAAGEIALYKGDLAQVQKFFKKCAEMESNPEYKKIFEYYSKKTNAEKAVKVAREYYRRTESPEKIEA